MRQNPNAKRTRGRGGRKISHPRSHVMDSNGPSVRVRGNALQIFEKYQQLARDASAGGDRVAAENLLQHAEHYYRLANLNGPSSVYERRPRDNGADGAQPVVAARHDAAPESPEGGVQPETGEAISGQIEPVEA
ncbi:MAG: DUF4167 domain-containing protein [Alphaproteobacteria bacterium]